MRFEDLKVGMWVVTPGGERREVLWVAGNVASLEPERGCTVAYIERCRPLTLGDLEPGERFEWRWGYPAPDPEGPFAHDPAMEGGYRWLSTSEIPAATAKSQWNDLTGTVWREEHTCTKCDAAPLWGLEFARIDSAFYCTIHAVEAGMPDPYAEHLHSRENCTAEQIPHREICDRVGNSGARSTMLRRVPDYTHPRARLRARPAVACDVADFWAEGSDV